MSTEEIVAKYESLSEEDQKLVMDFIDFHLQQLNNANATQGQAEVPQGSVPPPVVHEDPAGVGRKAGDTQQRPDGRDGNEAGESR